MKKLFFGGIWLFFLACSCNKEVNPPINNLLEWQRTSAPVFRDMIPAENYQTASDPHVFFDDNGTLQMIYTGDVNGKPAIKLATGDTWQDWSQASELLFELGPSGLDSHKETGFYRKSPSGKHQIYYIGYPDEATYEAQIYLAEATHLIGPYEQRTTPVVAKGTIAGEAVYCMTSPSVMEHEGRLYLTFIGWDASPNNVTEVWVMGAISTDDGHTWTDFQKVDTRIGMEGQVTKTPEGTFIAVRTGDYEEREAIFYATADHPFGPWTEVDDPILAQAGAPYEKDAIIAPQITLDPATNEPYLYYTGADYQTGWWVMLAEAR